MDVKNVYGFCVWDIFIYDFVLNGLACMYMRLSWIRSYLKLMSSYCWAKSVVDMLFENWFGFDCILLGEVYEFRLYFFGCIWKSRKRNINIKWNENFPDSSIHHFKLLLHNNNNNIHYNILFDLLLSTKDMITISCR